MELEEFIHSSLIQIMSGIKAAREDWQKKDDKISGDGIICPAWDNSSDHRNRVQEVKFDVAVTAASKTEGGGGAGIKGSIKVVELDLSGKVSHSAENSTISRISFSVSILPPTTLIKPPLLNNEKKL